jgi:uncharacterized membrane protein
MLMIPEKSRLDRAIDLIPWLVAALFGGIALHLLTILLLPDFTPHSAYRRLALDSPAGELRILPRASPEQSGPAFSDPFAALALCRFDLAQGPLRLRARSDGDHPVSVSLRLADGTVIYSANDRQSPNGRFNLLVVTQDQADALDAASENAGQPENEDKSEEKGADNAARSQDDRTQDELRLISPRKKGFVLVRALSLREGDYETAATAAKIDCAIEKPAP